jgi:uncharacterized protein (DUF362 family)
MKEYPDPSCSIGDDGKLRCPVLSEPGKLYVASDIKTRKVGSKPIVGIARNPDPSKATEHAVGKIGGMCKFVKKNDLVGIKVNITGGSSTNKASWTSPAVTKKVVEMVRGCGGNPVLFDSSMIWTDMEPIAEKEGWYSWAKENKVPLVDLHHLPVIPFHFGDDGVMNVDKASRLIKDIDVLVNIPKMKTHMLMTISIGLKNNYGLLPRADKGVYHGKGIDETIAEVNRAFPTTLTIIDGTIAGEGEAGPLTPDPIPDYNTVIASNDVACADAVAAKFMGFKNPMKIRHLRFAHGMGVGNAKCFENEDVAKEMASIFGSHPKDGKFEKPDPRVIEGLADTTKIVAASPGGASLMSNVSDMFLGNLSYFFGKTMRSVLVGITRLQRRYIGKDLITSKNIHGLNLHPEDETDAYVY